MKIFVMVDMEGISGVCSGKLSGLNAEKYHLGCLYAAWDTNACIQGCFEAGADEVLVVDAHSTGVNMPWHELDKRAEYIQGEHKNERLPGIAEYDGIILLGYHAMAGETGALLSHTMSSGSWQKFKMNGLECGEIAIDAGIAGDYDVPVIMVSGDDFLCREAQKFFPWVASAEVKKAMGRQGAKMLSKEKAHQLISKTAKFAVSNIENMQPYKVPHPVEMELELYASCADFKNDYADAEILDKNTFRVSGENVHTAFEKLFTVI